MRAWWLGVGLGALVMACGPSSAPKGAGGGGGAGSGGEPQPDPAAEYAPLDVGADYASWTKMNTEPFFSKPHGKRKVDVYVNSVGEAAFKDRGAEFPVGSIIVKTSFEAGPSGDTVAGPIFIMEKKAAGFDAENGDWWYGLHWENVPENWRARMGGASQVYWRTPSKKVGYCVGCHKVYPQQVGGVPKGVRAWEVDAEAPGDEPAP